MANVSRFLAVMRVALAVLLGPLSSNLAFGQSTITASTATGSAVLGSAYRSDQESFVGQSCVSGVDETAGTSLSTFSFDQSLSERQAASQLGLGIGGRARFGAVEFSASARFLKSAVSSAYSVSAVWVSEYRMATQRLKDISRNEVGDRVRRNDQRWRQTCGDEYVNEVVKGARLFFSIRLDFSSLEAKQSFEARFQVTGPLFGVQGDLSRASREFSREARVTVSALQLGGDVSQLTGVFSSEDEARRGLVQCTLGDFERCASVITEALSYATDLSGGFPSQLAPGAQPGAADILYRTVPYSAIGIYPNEFPELTEAIRGARHRVHGLFELHFALQVLAERLLEIPLGDAKNEVERQRDIAARNVNKIILAAGRCYDTPTECPVASEELELEEIDENALSLPPLPVASFRLMTSGRGIWPREASVLEMKRVVRRPLDLIQVIGCFGPQGQCGDSTTTVGKPAEAPRWITPEDPGDVYTTNPYTTNPPDFFGPEEPIVLADLIEEYGEGSIVLQVEGVALESAMLYFENRKLWDDPIPLQPHASGYNEKYGEGRAAIVIESTRGNPGWRDVDLAQERGRLWADGLNRADGIFYLVVLDQLGREVRFDLEYQNWDRRLDSRTRRERFRYSWRNRWWNPEPFVAALAEPGEWSFEGFTTGFLDRRPAP